MSVVYSQFVLWLQRFTVIFTTVLQMQLGGISPHFCWNKDSLSSYAVAGTCCA